MDTLSWPPKLGLPAHSLRGFQRQTSSWRPVENNERDEKAYCQIKRAQSIERPQGHFVYILTQFQTIMPQHISETHTQTNADRAFWKHEKL